jgi:hypothetical protein
VADCYEDYQAWAGTGCVHLTNSTGLLRLTAFHSILPSRNAWWGKTDNETTVSVTTEFERGLNVRRVEATKTLRNVHMAQVRTIHLHLPFWCMQMAAPMRFITAATLHAKMSSLQFAPRIRQLPAYNVKIFLCACNQRKL